MKEQVFTFWEGEMPSYIKLCMRTWKFDYVLLNYDNLNQYTDLDVSEIHGAYEGMQVKDILSRFSLPKIADVVRVHVLRDNGGYWLDTDTIMVKDELPKENMIGYQGSRDQTIGFLHTEPHTDMYNKWAKHQDDIVFRTTVGNNSRWDIMGNVFTNPYVGYHSEITIADVTPCWPETYLFNNNHSRYHNYQELYFTMNLHLSDFKPTNMFMLHNSWTPNWYKQLSEDEVLNMDVTLSNILKELLQ